MSTDIIDELRRKAAARPGTIVYPEPEDARIIEAARQVAEAGIARPILVGRQDRVPAEVPPGVGVEVVELSDRLDRFAREYVKRRGIEEAIARRVVRKPLMHAAMMVALGEADAMVAGVKRATASVVSAASLAIGYREGVTAPSSSLIMVLPRLGDREDVPLVFADCAVNVEPSAEELAGIALAAADTARKLLGLVPRVALLSFSTHGSAVHPKVDLVREATRLAAERMRDGHVEGELQLDAALVPAVVGNKVDEQNGVAGRANVLVFPDLNAGNIAYKAVQYFAGARAVGPILQGFARPVSDLSRGASVADIVDATAVTVLQVEGAANSGP
ncbi:MAG: phosphate acyltransferase [Planctomycetota bacterium]|jgi:phosphate acetyltransferase